MYLSIKRVKKDNKRKLNSNSAVTTNSVVQETRNDKKSVGVVDNRTLSSARMLLRMDDNISCFGTILQCVRQKVIQRAPIKIKNFETNKIVDFDDVQPIPKGWYEVVETENGFERAKETHWKYPLGFRDEKHFRDTTRPLAEANRDATLVVTGSSVTGQSADGTRPFRDKSYPKKSSYRSKEDTRSDIDMGLVKPKESWGSEVTNRGFPGSGATKLMEIDFSKKVENETGHTSGLKYFDKWPRNKDGTERYRIVRAHTPEAERDSLPGATYLDGTLGAGGLRIRRDQIPSSVDISEGAIIYVGGERKKILYVSEYQGTLTIDYGIP